MEDLPSWMSVGKFLGGLAGSILIMLFFSWLFDQLDHPSK